VVGCMTEIEAICQRLGITESAYQKRLKRWGDPVLAASQGRYEIAFPHERKRKVRQPKESRRGRDFPHHQCAYPLTDEQRQVAAVLRGWR
jgi:hypothetical protein